MTVQAGGLLDQKYRRAIEAQGPNTSTALSMEGKMYGGPGKVPAYDWPLPRQRPRVPPLDNLTWLKTLVTNTLIGKDFFYGASGQSIPQYDWPVPKAPAPHRENRTFIDKGVTDVLIGQDRFYSGPGQVPVYTWTVPIGPRQPLEHRTFIDKGVTDVLRGQDIIYGDPGESPVYDWPNPKGYPRPLEHKTFVDGHVSNTLIGQDRLYGAPGESPVYDWIVPKGYPRPLEHRTHLLNLVTAILAGQDSIYAGPGQVPVYTWTVPAGPQPSRENRTFLTSLVDLILDGQDRMYAGPGQVARYEWIVPRGQTRPLLFDQALDLIGLLGTVIVAPVGEQLLVDRFLAILPRPTADALRNTVLTLLAGQDAFYGAPGQAPSFPWIVPRGQQRSVPIDQSLNLLGLLAVAAASPIGTQLYLDRMLATLPRPTADALRNLVLTTLVGQDAIYGSPGESPTYDWPNPRGAAPSRENRTYLTTLVDLILAGQGRIYGAPGEVPTYDWRNPKGPSRAQVIDTLNLIAELTFVAPTRPVGSIIYPGPRPYLRPMFLDLVYDFLVGTNRTVTVDPTSALSATGQTGALSATGMTSAMTETGETDGTDLADSTSVDLGPSDTKAKTP